MNDLKFLNPLLKFFAAAANWLNWNIDGSLRWFQIFLQWRWRNSIVHWLACVIQKVEDNSSANKYTADEDSDSLKVVEKQTRSYLSEILASSKYKELSLRPRDDLPNMANRPFPDYFFRFTSSRFRFNVIGGRISPKNVFSLKFFFIVLFSTSLFYRRSYKQSFHSLVQKNSFYFE